MIPPFGLAPSEELGVVLQAAATGALIGTALAARQKIRDPRTDPTLPPMMWALAGVVAGVILLIGKALRWW